MHFYDVIKEISEKIDIILYVDMDGVIASYDAGKPIDFENKRPLKENIKKLEEISKITNVELNILSICKKNNQVEEKNNWLDKYAPFFRKGNRVIISKEEHEGISSPDLKANYLINIDTNKQVIMLDDDNVVLKTVIKRVPNIIAFQDSELID